MLKTSKDALHRMIPKTGQFIAYYIDQWSGLEKVVSNVSARGLHMVHYIWVGDKLYEFSESTCEWVHSSPTGVVNYIKQNALVAGFLPVDMSKARIQL